MGAPVPDEPVGGDGHRMGDALPLPHQNGPGPTRRRCPALPGRVRERALEQSVDFACRCLPHAPVSALLPIIGDAERKKLAAERPRRLRADLLLPEVSKPRTRQVAEIGEVQIRLGRPLRHGYAT